jgi:hypothetical protein
MKLNWKELIGKRVFLTTKKKFEYTGTITEIVDSGDGLVWVHIIDKFNKLVVFLQDEIVLLVEK